MTSQTFKHSVTRAMPLKRDRDTTDFREVNTSYDHRESGCIFCEMPCERVIAENELAYAILDAFPVTEGHTLIIPKRHVSDFLSLSTRAKCDAAIAGRTNKTS